MALIKSIFPCLALVIILSLFSLSESRDFVVGGNNKSWKVPSSPNEFNKWAENTRFQINDSIVLKYDAKIDSVLQVSEESYKTCNISNPIKSYNDGDTKITLDKSGPFFFISGAQGHCHKGQKLVIVVLSANHRHSPAPSPVNHHLAPAPGPAKSGGSGLKAGFLGGVVVVGILALV